MAGWPEMKLHFCFYFNSVLRCDFPENSRTFAHMGVLFVNQNWRTYRTA